MAHNKILAKFASGMHKPAQQTIVTLECVPALMATTPIPKLRQLGGKFGEEIMHALQISTVGEAFLPTLPPLVHHFPGAVPYLGTGQGQVHQGCHISFTWQLWPFTDVPHGQHVFK